jgi:hypothetical protein
MEESVLRVKLIHDSRRGLQALASYPGGIWFRGVCFLANEQWSKEDWRLGRQAR